MCWPEIRIIDHNSTIFFCLGYQLQELLPDLTGNSINRTAKNYVILHDHRKIDAQPLFRIVLVKSVTRFISFIKKSKRKFCFTIFKMINIACSDSVFRKKAIDYPTNIVAGIFADKENRQSYPSK